MDVDQRGANMRTYLTRRNGTYYVRVRVPRPLIAIVGRSEIVRSLGTHDRLTAVEKLPHIEIGIRSLLGDAWTMTDLKNQQGATAGEGVDIDAKLRNLERQLHGATTRLESFRPACHGYQDDLLEGQITEKINTVEAAVENTRNAVQAAGKATDDTGAAGRHAAEIDRLTAMVAGLRQHLDTLDATLKEPANGGTLAGVEAVLPTAPVGEPSERFTTDGDKPAKVKLLSQARQTYETRFKGKVGKKTLRSQLDSMKDFEAFLGDVPIHTVTRQDAIDYRAALEQRRSDRGARGQLSHATVQKYLSHLRGLFDYACDEQFCAANVFANVRATKPSRTIREAQQRSPFKPEELQRFLDAPLFTGYKSAGRPHHPGPQMPNHDSRFWFPLIMLWAGLRNDEITQLRFDSLVKHYGVTCFDIDEQVKTPAGWRLVPVHSQLCELGFLDWVEWRKQSTESGYIFDQFAYSQFFNDRFLPRLGLKRPDLVLYSLRHNFADEMKGLDEEARDRVMGHAHGHVRGRYGSSEITQRQMQVVEAVAYKGVDFSKLPTFSLDDVTE